MANSEAREIRKLLRKLLNEPKRHFAQPHDELDAPTSQGVYIIRKNESVVHVGRTLRGVDGLKQRLKDHLYGSSSFAQEYLKVKGESLRTEEYTYQYLEIPTQGDEDDETNQRKRALLEAFAIGKLCPEHVGLGA